MSYTDDYIADILKETKVIALIGFSANEARPSYGVARYLRNRGYRVIPVNPGLAGQKFGDETIYGSIADVPVDVDMVDVFRASDAVAGLTDEALKRWPGLKTIWLQIGVRDDAAMAKAEARGVKTVQNRCPAIEIPRLGLEPVA